MSTSAADDNKPIFLISYPKIIMLYPTFFGAIIAGIATAFLGEQNSSTVCLAFLALFSINLVVLAFDFPRTTSLTMFFLITAVVLGLVLLFRNYPDILPAITNVLRKIEPQANVTFYFCFATLLGVIYLAVLINIRFDYWEVRPNELLHHHGFLSNLERFSAPNLRISKEIDDVFEFMLLRSGRLILHPSNEPRAFVLDNVLFIDQKEARITRMLGALQVQVRDDSVPLNRASDHPA
ncbi:MAG: hypothetical protein U0872_05860 [Planctomycetaceae bacterium]